MAKRTPQTPPGPGWAYVPKTRSWAGPGGEKLSRRQYDKQFGSLARSGATSYEKKAQARAAAKAASPNVKIGRGIYHKGYTVIPVTLGPDGTPQDLLRAVARIIPSGQEVVINALGAPIEDYNDSTDEIWRNVLPTHLSDDLRDTPEPIAQTLAENVAEIFEAPPTEYSVMYRKRKTEVPGSSARRRK